MNTFGIRFTFNFYQSCLQAHCPQCATSLTLERDMEHKNSYFWNSKADSGYTVLTKRHLLVWYLKTVVKLHMDNNCKGQEVL